MGRDSAATERLRNLILKLTSMTAGKELHWERQVGSAHRSARWNEHLLILGPSAPVSDTTTPRYLFITPFNSPACIEVTSNDEELGALVMDLVKTVESSSSDEPPTDPFAVSEDFLSRLTD
jgi:hypothetical protein